VQAVDARVGLQPFAGEMLSAAGAARAERQAALRFLRQRDQFLDDFAGTEACATIMFGYVAARRSARGL
jgi:hypothetical protein